MIEDERFNPVRKELEEIGCQSNENEKIAKEVRDFVEYFKLPKNWVIDNDIQAWALFRKWEMIGRNAAYLKAHIDGVFDAFVKSGYVKLAEEQQYLKDIKLNS